MREGRTLVALGLTKLTKTVLEQFPQPLSAQDVLEFGKERGKNLGLKQEPGGHLYSSAGVRSPKDSTHILPVGLSPGDAGRLGGRRLAPTKLWRRRSSNDKEAGSRDEKEAETDHGKDSVR